MRVSEYFSLFLKVSFFITIISLFIAWLAKEKLVAGILGIVGFYGAIVTINLLVVHLLLVLLSSLKSRN